MYILIEYYSMENYFLFSDILEANYTQSQSRSRPDAIDYFLEGEDSALETKKKKLWSLYHFCISLRGGGGERLINKVE